MFALANGDLNAPCSSQEKSELEPPQAGEGAATNIQKFKNVLLHMEHSIKQNRKKCIMICNECYAIMRHSEVVAMDLLFTEFLIGTATPSQMYNFIDSCTRPTFTLTSGDPREIDMAAEHIKMVHTQIQTSMLAIINSGQKYGNMNFKKANDLVQFLREQGQKFENDLKRLEEASDNSNNNSSALVIDINNEEN